MIGAIGADCHRDRFYDSASARRDVT